MDFFHALLIYCILLVGRIAGKPIPTNPRLFGCNIDWVSALPQFHLRINNTNLLNGFTASGLGATRYPGGNVGNCFNWTYARDNWADTTSNYCLTKVNNIKKSALIMGFGSIGEKHAMILNKYFNYKNIYIFTKRKIKKFKH